MQEFYQDMHGLPAWLPVRRKADDSSVFLEQNLLAPDELLRHQGRPAVSLGQPWEVPDFIEDGRVSYDAQSDWDQGRNLSYQDMADHRRLLHFGPAGRVHRLHHGQQRPGRQAHVLELRRAASWLLGSGVEPLASDDKCLLSPHSPALPVPQVPRQPTLRAVPELDILGPHPRPAAALSPSMDLGSQDFPSSNQHLPALPDCSRSFDTRMAYSRPSWLSQPLGRQHFTAVEQHPELGHTPFLLTSPGAPTGHCEYLSPADLPAAELSECLLDYTLVPDAGTHPGTALHSPSLSTLSEHKGIQQVPASPLVRPHRPPARCSNAVLLHALAQQAPAAPPPSALQPWLLPQHQRMSQRLPGRSNNAWMCKPDPDGPLAPVSSTESEPFDYLPSYTEPADLKEDVLSQPSPPASPKLAETLHARQQYLHPDAVTQHNSDGDLGCATSNHVDTVLIEGTSAITGLAAEEAGILDNRALNDPAAMPACTEVMERKPKREQYLKRYREKKRRRLHAKTIRYHKRKLNADRRPRVRGRFVKASEAAELLAGSLTGLHCSAATASASVPACLRDGPLCRLPGEADPLVPADLGFPTGLDSL